jgi:Na+/citrate or Na+/malate symporter
VNSHTRDLIAVVTSIAFALTVCLLIVWRVISRQPLDTSDLTLVMVLVALIAATTGIQLPGVINRVNGGGNIQTLLSTTTTTTSSVPHPDKTTPTPTPTPDAPTTSTPP